MAVVQQIRSYLSIPRWAVNRTWDGHHQNLHDVPENLWLADDSHEQQKNLARKAGSLRSYFRLPQGHHVLHEVAAGPRVAEHDRG